MSDDVHCRIVIDDGGLPHRTDVVLRREEGRVALYLARLRGDDGKGEPDEDPEPPTVDELVAALEARTSRTIGVAAFLAGRCECDGTAGTRLDAVLADLIASCRVDELDLLAEGYIEAALSVALRGDPDVGRAALGPFLPDGGSGDQDWLAASHLAQLGDPSGWPLLLRDTRDGIEHVRLMAVRQLVIFLPYDGTDVAGTTIDVEAELRRAVDDDSEWIRRELPDLLEEAGFDPAPR